MEYMQYSIMTLSDEWQKIIDANEVPFIQQILNEEIQEDNVKTMNKYSDDFPTLHVEGHILKDPMYDKETIFPQFVQSFENKVFATFLDGYFYEFGLESLTLFDDGTDDNRIPFEADIKADFDIPEEHAVTGFISYGNHTHVENILNREFILSIENEK